MMIVVIVMAMITAVAGGIVATVLSLGGAVGAATVTVFNGLGRAVTVKVGTKKKKMCEDCADRLKEEGAIAEESEAVVQNMMGFKGRR